MADQYSQMQRRQYERSAGNSHFGPGIVLRDEVVCSFEGHNKWSDNHQYLFRHSKMDGTKSLTALDFACGPGRNILLYSDRFKKIDGVDLSPNNLANAKIYTSVLPADRQPTLYLCNGLDLSGIPTASYDVIFSTIAMQHICCYSIRLGYLKEFSRVLKPGGFLCIQMGFGSPYPAEARAIGYFENGYSAEATNSFQDTRIEDPKDVERDLLGLGFVDFEFNIRPSGPGDGGHPNWIYWSAVKN